MIALQRPDRRRGFGGGRFARHPAGNASGSSCELDKCGSRLPPPSRSCSRPAVGRLSGSRLYTRASGLRLRSDKRGRELFDMFSSMIPSVTIVASSTYVRLPCMLHVVLYSAPALGRGAGRG
ncbi:hypothetical protein GSI_01671 [Ganoderma sinense ZZ0214-1]|uniref:Uncharacterized protein n=1 Tax=Ganoderma sinense ZZ0214-1 TaxID=1077348 RepID=A0A2G8SQG4_9APHY|nr:hypothetical protein GSI_01671 [Ganoderma sinense ZZ0214-1]